MKKSKELDHTETHMLRVHTEVTKLKWLRRKALDKAVKLSYTEKIVKLTLSA